MLYPPTLRLAVTAYGQTFIADDHFLSLAVSFSGVANAVARPISGLLADKIGCRTKGNITPYLTSYLRNVTGDDYLDYADTLWIQITMDISTCVLTSAAGLLFNRLHTKLCIFIGIFFSAASTFGTYWAIQESFPLTILTYGVIGGIPHALLYPAAINIAVRAYGQTFITDDHFLTLVASISSIFNALGRPFWGLIGDRVGYRIVALLCQCIAAALVATFVTTEDTGRAAFFVWVCAMFLSMCGFFTMKAALMLALFGSKYFNSNLGLLITNGVFGAILTGIIAPVLKDAFGWHGMFYFGFGGIFVESGVGVKL
nr:hypothetical protein BaRGS_010879 [Batillaria attramentaria]